MPIMQNYLDWEEGLVMNAGYPGHLQLNKNITGDIQGGKLVAHELIARRNRL
jgi:hypothetical protein